MNKRVNKQLLERWNERVSNITRSGFSFNESEEDRAVRVARAQRDYAYFVTTYFPHLATKPTARFQSEAAEWIAKEERARALFEWSRGHAKSSHMGCLIPLWLMARGEKAFRHMVIVSKSEDSAKALLGDLQAELSTNEAYKRDFNLRTEPGSEWQAGRFSTSDGTSFVALGRGQSPRGLKKRGQRPDYILIDDIDDDALCRNEARVREAFNWMMTALFGTMAVGRGRFIMVGNRIGKNSILARFAETKGIHHSVVNILDKNGNPSWSENYTLEEIAELRRTMGERNFQKEYMNNPVTEGSIFKREWMRYEKPLRLKEYKRIVAYTDPSFKSTKQNDYKATVVVGKTREGCYHVLRCYASQTSVSEMVAWHYDIERWIDGRVPIRYYMEANFIQDLLLDEFRKEGVARGGRQIPITADKRKKPDKFSRIEAMQPLFERGLIAFCDHSTGMETLIEQLLSIEPGSRMHDDAPDALEGAVWMLNRGGGATHYYVPEHTSRHY